MNLFISDEDLVSVSLFVKRCGSNCECGRLLHRLYTSYLIAVKELKKADYKAWERICENDKGYVGAEELPPISNRLKQVKKKGNN
jgi:hypothetical protein